VTYLFSYETYFYRLLGDRGVFKVQEMTTTNRIHSELPLPIARSIWVYVSDYAGPAAQEQLHLRPCGRSIASVKTDRPGRNNEEREESALPFLVHNGRFERPWLFILAAI
jgi:hypothetical protein